MVIPTPPPQTQRPAPHRFEAQFCTPVALLDSSQSPAPAHDSSYPPSWSSLRPPDKIAQKSSSDLLSSPPPHYLSH